MEGLPDYFVLCGKDSYRAYTTSYRPTNIYFECSVKLRGFTKDIKIVSIRPPDTPHVFPVIKKELVYVYKSNLRKCIRRKLVDRAVRSAYALLCIDPCTALRRLPIIMIEDVLPHPSIVPIVWWMMATTKGYQLSDGEVSYILGVVYELCQIDLYQVKNHLCKSSGRVDPKEWSALPQTRKDLLWSMEFRRGYGGMACDREMIEYLQRGWIERFRNKDRLWDYLKAIEISPLDLKTLGVCDKEDIILEAIDQHCFTWIPSKLSTKVPFSTYQIKGAIWYYRSRINARKVCDGSVPLIHHPELEVVYREIEDELERLCLWIYTNIL